MVYIFETKLDKTKSVFFALKYIYGIGFSKSYVICKKVGFAKNLLIKNLSDRQIKKLVNVTNNSEFLITNALKKFKKLILKNLVSIKSYRGLKKIKSFPIKNQRISTNAKNTY